MIPVNNAPMSEEMDTDSAINPPTSAKETPNNKRNSSARLILSKKCAIGRNNGNNSKPKAQNVGCLPSAIANRAIATMSCKIRILKTSRPYKLDRSPLSSNTLIARTVLEKARLAPNIKAPVTFSPKPKNTAPDIPLTINKCKPPTLNTSRRNNELNLSFKPTVNNKSSIPISARCAKLCIISTFKRFNTYPANK